MKRRRKGKDDEVPLPVQYTAFTSMHTVSVALVKASPRDTTNGDDPDLAQFEQDMSRVSRDLASNRRRFSLLSWQPMLDGDLALVCSWGRPETHGRSRTIFSPE